MEEATSGLIFALLLDGQGGAKTLTWEQVNHWDPSQGLLWVHGDYSCADIKEWLFGKSQLDPLAAEALIVEDLRPSCHITDESIRLFIRAVNTNPGQDPEDMVSLRIWLDSTRIITTRKRLLLSVNDVRQQFDNNRGPKTTVEAMLMLNNRVLDRVANVVDDIDERSDDLEEQVINIESRTLRFFIANIRREAIMLRRYLAPQREALSRLATEETKLINKKSRFYFREITERLIRYIEDLDSARDRATIAQEELIGRISEQMDQRMYLLSMVAVFFLPLTFITGLFGINVAGIPGSAHKYAFWWVCSGLLFLISLMLFFFKKRKWL